MSIDNHRTIWQIKVEGMAAAVLAASGDGVEAAVAQARNLAANDLDFAQMDAGEALGRKWVAGEFGQ